ncbi:MULTISPECIES: 3-deoxy-7-phosphoheptulonate synthase [unclassified Prochlorococcus]|uniref:3-deoxy-7-phosphoheptulonate synthase n=1 Tax=unclassified Prochlorococcus TaxID=2627481 RepID=UPI0005339378|nr:MULTISPECIES: 3-deoxy-7-phosphoheptulonate synthase [unclassified Prochlorococcus]KGG14519.1 2-keto-3-deoxy-D-arabino-heptulosonate-7- phosphate synthase I alpha [Prochlorococcus sp. MIT 0602]KGG16056.1 2-keto-3-deoxy-D-arabino-heptulosonate-7- phosphate synthase I alpha [Prochlorococcus sp. MIT 0603]
MSFSTDFDVSDQTSDLHVVETRPLLPPASLHSDLPLDLQSAAIVSKTRTRIQEILSGIDSRLLVIVGPCSVHDIAAAKDYAIRLKSLRERFEDKLEIVMRVYFEKPRTTTGWKGLINDPHLDGSYDINSGLRRARSLLLDLAHLEIPSATELLDPVVPQYIADLISWTAIGARTTESQTHREMASGLSMPIGYKNGTDGTIAIAINAMKAASKPHHFLGINHQGSASIISTTGNPDGHLVLRGGSSGTNYDVDSVGKVSKELSDSGSIDRVMIDCSHGNSKKDYRRQVDVLRDVALQIQKGSSNIMGVMLESHLVEGNQSLSTDLSKLTYGQSITDACIDINTTEMLLEELAAVIL